MNLLILKQLVQSRRKPLAGLAILFILSLALQLSNKLYSEPKLDELRIQLQKQRETEGRGAALQSREMLYKSGLADLAKFQERIYPKSNFARFVGELYDLAENNRLDLTTISYKPSQKSDEQYLEYQLAITVSGNYLKLKKFISELERSTNLLVIDAISFSAGSPSSDIVQLRMNISSYFRLEKQ